MTTSSAPKIDLRAVPSRMNAKFKPLVLDTHRINVLIGGASSSKSYSIAQKIAYKTIAEPGHRYLVVRKVAATLRHSVFDLILDIITKWNMKGLFAINRTDLSIRCLWNESEIIFTGLDDVEKLKSIHRITDIWIEEASEISEADFNQLSLRLRGKTEHKKQITLTLNPISALHWIKKRFFDHVEPDCLTHRSTYRDNRFLDEDTIKHLESITDPYFKAVYVDGEWGIYGNVVFTNFVIEDFHYTEDDLENVCQGMDFGFAHASTIERLGFRDGELYAFDELYGKGWTNDDFIQAAQDYWGDDAKYWQITADSAEADRIEEWGRKGYRVTGAKKGKGSLRFGIDFLTSKRLHIQASRCPNLAREVQTFKRREDKDGNALDEFVEINDDCIAAARYATEYIWGETRGYIFSGDESDYGGITADSFGL